MIDVDAWVRAARRGEAVGRCTAYGCGGHLFCPADKDGMTTPFHDRTDRETDVTIRWYEADCHTCQAVYAYPNGRTADDARDGRNDKRRRENRERTQRVGEFVAAATSGRQTP